MEERYKRIVFGDVVIEVKGSYITTRKGENGELILNAVKLPEQPEEEPYFFRITQYKRKKIRRWLKTQNGKTEREKHFLEIVKEGLNKINYDYWISTIEPTMKDGNIQFIKGEKVELRRACKKWEQMAEEYCKERGSRLASLYELFIWYAWRIVKGYWTLDYVANDSSSAGNYRDSPNHYSGIEVAGARKVGGFYDGIGNTCKIVTFKEGYALVGANWNCNGFWYPIASFEYCFNSRAWSTRFAVSAVFVLTK